jgi:hypothetical protein
MKDDERHADLASSPSRPAAVKGVDQPSAAACAGRRPVSACRLHSGIRYAVAALAARHGAWRDEGSRHAPVLCG